MQRYLDAVWTFIERSDDTALFILKVSVISGAVLWIAAILGGMILLGKYMNEKDDDAFEVDIAQIADANVAEHRLAEAA